mmetsp:Transcript_32814/g.39850  ORF Transcript_32814/g.39850 Transcript_32814/m.39850 type:complete len:692 (-) Transcript_32814:35-2110(-)
MPQNYIALHERASSINEGSDISDDTIPNKKFLTNLNRANKNTLQMLKKDATQLVSLTSIEFSALQQHYLLNDATQGCVSCVSPERTQSDDVTHIPLPRRTTKFTSSSSGVKHGYFLFFFGFFSFYFDVKSCATLACMVDNEFGRALFANATLNSPEYYNYTSLIIEFDETGGTLDMNETLLWEKITAAHIENQLDELYELIVNIKVSLFSQDLRSKKSLQITSNVSMFFISGAASNYGNASSLIKAAFDIKGKRDKYLDLLQNTGMTVFSGVDQVIFGEENDAVVYHQDDGSIDELTQETLTLLLAVIAGLFFTSIATILCYFRRKKQIEAQQKNAAAAARKHANGVRVASTHRSNGHRGNVPASIPLKQMSAQTSVTPSVDPRLTTYIEVTNRDDDISTLGGTYFSNGQEFHDPSNAAVSNAQNNLMAEYDYARVYGGAGLSPSLSSAGATVEKSLLSNSVRSGESLSSFQEGNSSLPSFESSLPKQSPVTSSQQNNIKKDLNKIRKSGKGRKNGYKTPSHINDISNRQQQQQDENPTPIMNNKRISSSSNRSTPPNLLSSDHFLLDTEERGNGSRQTKNEASLFQQSSSAVVAEEHSFNNITSSMGERIEVTVPPGKLGLVIDTPDGRGPAVHAIKDTSILADRLVVGDLLVSLDGDDTTSMTAVRCSKLISQKSRNPSRHLVFLRMQK